MAEEDVVNILEIQFDHNAPMIKKLFEVISNPVSEFNLEIVNNKEQEDEDENLSDTEDYNSDDEYEEYEEPCKSYIKVLALNPVTSIIINLKLYANKFEIFKCKKSRMYLGIHAATLYQALKHMDKEDVLTLFVEQDNEDKLGIKIRSPLKNKETITTINLVNIPKEEFTFPDVKFETRLNIQTSELHGTCKTLNEIGNYIQLSVINNKFICKCKGDYSDSMVEYLDDGGDVLTNSVVKIMHNENNVLNIVENVFDLHNINLFNKFTSLCDYIEIYFRQDFPIVFMYSVGTIGKIFVCHAPIKT